MWIFMTILFAVLVFLCITDRVGAVYDVNVLAQHDRGLPLSAYMLQTPVEANPFGGHFAKGESPI